LDVKTIGGNKGRSSIGAAAYRAGEKLRNEHDGNIHDYTRRRSSVSASAYRSGEDINNHDYTRKGRIVHNEIMLPSHAPESFRDRNTLWNSVEKSERNHNARTGREIVVALPNELSEEQQITVVRDYVQRNFVDKGMCADFSIHAGHIHSRKNEIYPFQDLTVRKDNPHAHIQLTVRPLNRDGTWGAKSKKEYILDRNGDRIKLPSGNWKSRKVDATDWDRTETLLKWREDWTLTVNKEFERLDIGERIDHRTLKAQGINREPTRHMGHKAWNLEKQGIKTRIGIINRQIMARNRAFEQRERQARAKLAEVQERQKISREPTAQAVAEYMNKLNEGYVKLKNQISDMNNAVNQRERETSNIESKIKALQQRTEDISKQNDNLQQAYTVRDSMGRFKDKREINAQIKRLEDTYRRSWDYYEKSFGITPNEGHQEIKRLQGECQKAYEETYALRRTTDTTPYTQRLREFEIEYKRQRLLAEIRPDSQEILQSLDRADVRLNHITSDDFKTVMHDMRPRQAEILMRNRYVRERERERERDFYERER